jgi:hypothetical protein
MWSQFPLMGIGQGNFYRLSDIASFSRSNFLILNHGENAHNYFLQTLTETGVVGVIVFLMALLAPILGIKNKKLLIPASIALLSLFLGNIFSHSFLVRENLMLAFIFFSLLFINSTKYLDLSGGHIFFVNKVLIPKYFLLAVFAFLLMGCIFEALLSFGKTPYIRGFFCKVDAGISEDKWTSGIFKIDVPVGAKGFEVEIRGDNASLPLQRKVNFVSINISDESQIKISTIFSGADQKYKWIYSVGGFSLPDKNASVLMISNDCFVPRNLGLGLDGRRLGVLIKNWEILKN